MQPKLLIIEEYLFIAEGPATFHQVRFCERLKLKCLVYPTFCAGSRKLSTK